MSATGVRALGGIVAAAFLIWIAAAIGPAYIARGSVGPLTNAADFRAFYCAGAAVAQHADPYRVEPLRACERAELASMGLQTFRDLVVAVPLPPYALGLFAALSAVPFASATCGWFTATLLAVIATALLLRGMTGAPVLLVVLTTVSCAFDAVLLGQLAPIVVLFGLLAAAALHAGRPSVCAACATVAMIEPHIALPLWLALFVFRRELRGPLLACGLALFAISATVTGLGLYPEYFMRELPSHALSETHALQAQYSLTTMLAVLAHVPDSQAILLGELDYGFMLAPGLYVAKRLSDVSRDLRILVLVPPAFTLLGGIFGHVYGLYIAIPAALLLSARFAKTALNPFMFAAVGIAASALMEAAFGEGLVGHNDAGVAALMARVPADALASAVSRIWQETRMPVEPSAIAAIVWMKAPALFGLAGLVIAATARAIRRRAAGNRYETAAA